VAAAPLAGTVFVPAQKEKDGNEDDEKAEK
jgi:hypothetical protein